MPSWANNANGTLQHEAQAEQETVNQPGCFTCGSGDEAERSDPEEDVGEAGSAFT